MKRLIAVAILLLIATVSYSQQTEAIPFFQGNVPPVYQARSLNAITLYIIGGSTTSAATFGVFGSTGISLTTTDGLYPGTTEFMFSRTDVNTIFDLVATLNGLATTVPGAEGGVVASIIQGYFIDGESARLTSIVYTGCLGVANIQTLTADDTNGISYILSKDSLDNLQQYYITDISAQATFATGTCFINIYDGVSSTSTQRRHEEIAISGLDAKADIPSIGAFSGSEWNNILRTGGNVRFDIKCSTNMSAGWINFTGFKN